jgi:uncharacterized membrane protein
MNLHGAALEARDRVTATVRTYSDSQLTRQHRFERRGVTALRRNRRAVERQARDVRHSVESGANEMQSSAKRHRRAGSEPRVSSDPQHRSEREAPREGSPFAAEPSPTPTAGSLDAIRPEDVEAFIAAERRGGSSAKTVHTTG